MSDEIYEVTTLPDDRKIEFVVTRSKILGTQTIEVLYENEEAYGARVENGDVPHLATLERVDFHEDSILVTFEKVFLVLPRLPQPSAKKIKSFFDSVPHLNRIG